MVKSAGTSKPEARPYELESRVSFEIKNFKGFSNLKIENLQRVNLFSGKNDIGKTSLLEALFIHCGIDNVTLPTLTSALRGVQQFDTDPERMFSHLFFDQQTDKRIEFKATDNKKHWSTLNLSLSPTSSSVLGRNDKPKSSASADQLLLVALELNYLDSAGRKLTSKAVPTKEGDQALEVQGGTVTRTARRQRGIILTSRPGLSDDDSNRFTKVAERKGTQELLPLLRKIEPRLQGLEILLYGGKPLIHADIGTSKLIPLHFCGSGLQRALVIELAIREATGGIVLIDEVENGIHHTVMKDVWKSIIESAERFSTQIFCTTHSWECIKAAHISYPEDNYNFRLQRLERQKTGEIVAKSYDREVLEAAVRANIEVR